MKKLKRMDGMDGSEKTPSQDGRMEEMMIFLLEFMYLSCNWIIHGVSGNAALTTNAQSKN